MTSHKPRNYQRYWRQLHAQFPRVLLAYSLSLAGVCLALALPWPIKFLIDDVLVGKTISPLLADMGLQMQVLAIAGTMYVLAMLTAFLLSVEKITHARIRECFSFNLRDELVQHVYRLSRFSRQAERSGELTMRMVSDTNIVSRLFCKTAPVAVKHLGVMLFTLVSIFFIDVVLGVLSLTLAIMLALVVVFYGSRVTDASKLKRQLEGEVSALTQETVNAIEHVQSMGLEAQSRSRYLDRSAASLEAGVEEVRVAVNMERTTQLVAGLALACIAGAGGMMVLDGQMTLGTLTVCLAYINALLKPIEKINDIATSVARGLVRCERLQAVFAADTSIEQQADYDFIEILSLSEIECSGVSYCYPGSDKPVVEDFSHRFVKGEATLIIGQSGSGKSTLLRLLLRLLSPDRGEIRAGGVNYPKLEPSELRSNFAVVLQDARLFSGSVRDVLIELAPEADEDSLYRALADVELLDLVEQLPEGLDSQIDESGSQVSGGQRARLLLARALLGNRAVLILDEPFANIDEHSRKIISKRLAAYKRQCILIIVTHETALLDIADHVLHQKDWQTVSSLRELTNAIS